jgi:hypothetical protein
MAVDDALGRLRELDPRALDDLPGMQGEQLRARAADKPAGRVVRGDVPERLVGQEDRGARVADRLPEQRLLDELLGLRGRAVEFMSSEAACLVALLRAPLVRRRVLLRRAAGAAHRRPVLLDDVARIGMAVLVRLDAAARVAGPVEPVRRLARIAPLPVTPPSEHEDGLPGAPLH